MAIPKKRTEPFRLVSAIDDAWRHVSLSVADKYFETRDLSKVDFCGASPTIFIVSPLLTKFEYLIPSGNTPAGQREILRRHLVGVEGLQLDWEDVDGRLTATRSSVDELPLSLVSELVEVILRSQSMGGSDLDFFSLPATWPEARRAIALALLRAPVAQSARGAAPAEASSV